MKHTSIWNKIASSFSIAFSYFIIIGVINSLLRHYFVKFFNNNKSNDQKQLDTIINKATFAIMTTIAVIEIFSLIAFKTSPLAGLGSLILNKFFGSNSGIDE